MLTAATLEEEDRRFQENERWERTTFTSRLNAVNEALREARGSPPSSTLKPSEQGSRANYPADSIGTFKPGEIILNRSRIWRVDYVIEDVITATSIDGGISEQHRFYLPFEHVRKHRVSPPDSSIVGNVAAHDLLIQAYKLSLIHGSAPLLSLQRSRVIPHQFQLVPVLMSMDMPKARILLADDVGLGKTIEAGLIATELLARQQAYRILVVCPANLREQWREALDHFFHLDAKIISTRHRREMERGLPAGSNPWEYFPYLITSIDYAKMAEIKAQILEQEWDIVIIDEAHNAAKPHQTTADQKVQMERWEFAVDIAKKANHLLLLTATPHNGYTDTYASLIRMLDVGAVTGAVHEPRIHREIAKRHVCQRRRKDVVEWLKKASDEDNPFPERDQEEVFLPRLAPEEKAILDDVEKLGQHILDSVKDASKYSNKLARWTILHFHKRALSSPRALVESLKNRLSKVEDRLAKAEHDEEEEESARITEPVARALTFDEDPGEQHTDEEGFQRLDRNIFAYSELLRREKEILEELLERSKKITPAKDTKLHHLLWNTLRNMMKLDPKVIIFTRYRDTLDYLESNISRTPAFKDAEILTLHGLMNESQRRELFTQFERSRKAILIATDCIAEGINLQYSCSQMIHYELPWNPNRLEQRAGRIDRYGQPKKVVRVKTLVMDETLEAVILTVLVRKAQKIREDYGFSPPFFGDDVSVLDLIREKGLECRLAKQTSLEDFMSGMRETREVPDPFSDESLDRIKSDSFYGQETLDLSEVEKRLRETEETVGSQEQMANFVRSGLNRFNCPVREVSSGVFRIEVTSDLLRDPEIEPVIERATFDTARAHKDPSLDAIDIGHPLVRRLIDVVKMSAFDDDSSYGRTAAMRTEAVKDVTALYTFLVRYAVNTKRPSIIEEIHPVGVEVYSGRVLSIEETRSLSSATPLPRSRTPDEISEDLSGAIQVIVSEKDGILQEAIERRMLALVEERRRFKERIDVSEEMKEWLEGIDDLTHASTDFLSAKLFYPAGPGGG